jgi:predicted RNA-binding Zn ribbon-like protein
MQIPGHIGEIDLAGGHPALDFVNTLHSWDAPAPRDYLGSGADVAAWMQRLGLVAPAVAGAFASLPPRQAAVLLRSARQHRARLHTLFAAVARGRRPPGDTLDWLNRALVRNAPYRKLESSGPAYVWRVQPDARAPASLLAPLVIAAAELLAGGQLERLRECPPPVGCGWLFVDTSRGGRRTWCRMETCGNLAKVRRYRARRRGDQVRESR